MRFVISKTKLYNLVSKHMALPKMKHTHFMESIDCKSYCLKWRAESDHNYRANLSLDGDSPVLKIESHGNAYEDVKLILKVIWSDIYKISGA